MKDGAFSCMVSHLSAYQLESEIHWLDKYVIGRILLDIFEQICWLLAWAIFITTRCYKLSWPRISRKFKVTLVLVDLKGSSAALLALKGLQKASLELCIDQVLQRSRFAVQKREHCNWEKIPWKTLIGRPFRTS